MSIVTLFTQAQLASGQTTLAQWTFELNPPADLNNSTTISSILADVGTGTASGLHADSATDWTTPVGNGSANSLNANTWAVGDYFQFSLSTLGHFGIGVTFDQTSSGTGPRDFSLDYSTDGVAFTSAGNYTVLANGASPLSSWSSGTYQSGYTFTFDLSSIAALDNATTVYFRLFNTSTVSANGGTVAAGGTSRVDNFTVSVVPEPSAFALIGGFGILALIKRRRA